MKNHLAFYVAIIFAAIIYSGCKKELYNPDLKNSGKSIASNLSSSVSSPLVDTSIVITPFGLRKKSDIHLIENGYHIGTTPDGHIQKIETATGKMVEDFGIPARMKKTTSQPNSVAVNNGSQAGFTPSALNPNWVAWALVTTYKQSPIQAFSTTWKVPTAPTTTHGGVLFIFNGLQSADSLSLLQPVLQYGANALGGGGNYWSVQNYYIPCSICTPQFVSTAIQVSPGTTITGAMTKTGTAGNYSYTSSFGSAYSAINLSVPNTAVDLKYGVETMEAYNLTSYTDYPADSAVRMTSITAGAGNTVTVWSLNNQTNNFGQHIKAPTNTEIDLYFHYGNDQTIRSFTKNNCTTGETGSSVPDTVKAYTYLASTVAAANTSAVNYLYGGAGQAYANAHGYCMGPYTFGVITTNSNPSFFNMTVNGVVTAFGRETAPQNQVNNVTNNPIKLLSNSTVIMQITSGYMPVLATLTGPFPTVHGVISGNNITFTGVNLSIGSSCSLTLN